MELFLIDTRTRLVDINKEWISTIKEFKKLITRSKGEINKPTKEFTFIYHYCDYRSKFANYSEDDKLKYCLKNADLDENTGIESDLDLLTAIIKYKALQKAPSLTFLTEIKEGLHTGIKVVKMIRKRLEDQLIKEKLDEFEVEMIKGKETRIDPVTKLTNSLTSLMRIGRELPDSLAAINELEEKVKKELGDEAGLRGDKQKGEREDKGSIGIKTGVTMFD